MQAEIQERCCNKSDGKSYGHYPGEFVCLYLDFWQDKFENIESRRIFPSQSSLFQFFPEACSLFIPALVEGKESLSTAAYSEISTKFVCDYGSFSTAVLNPGAFAGEQRQSLLYSDCARTKTTEERTAILIQLQNLLQLDLQNMRKSGFDFSKRNFNQEFYILNPENNQNCCFNNTEMLFYLSQINYAVFKNDGAIVEDFYALVSCLQAIDKSLHFSHLILAKYISDAFLRDVLRYENQTAEILSKEEKQRLNLLSQSFPKAELELCLFFDINTDIENKERLVEDYYRQSKFDLFAYF